MLHVAVEEKDWLLERDPATFWQTNQHRDWPAILVRYGGDADLVATLLARAWWDRATKAQRDVFGARP